jgi:hypothetical protein
VLARWPEVLLLVQVPPVEAVPPSMHRGAPPKSAKKLLYQRPPDEIRHGKLAELAQVRRQQHCQHHIAAGPAHQIGRPIAADEGNNPGQRNKGRCGHPVRRRGHAIGNRVNAAACHVKFFGRSGPCPYRDTDIERKGAPDKKICE